MTKGRLPSEEPVNPSGEDCPETEHGLDQTLEDSFPASDPPSSDPNPVTDEKPEDIDQRRHRPAVRQPGAHVARQGSTTMTDPKTTPKTLANQAMDQASRAREAASKAVQDAADAVDQGRATAADRLEGTASAVRSRMDELPGGQRVRELAHATADRLTSTADYVRTPDLNRMVEDVEAVVKNHPGPSLLVAAAFGFLLGRALARD
jgi:ElaB/YqjD/DUF883 family membrane-anchored ribosome-binding protein